MFSRREVKVHNWFANRCAARRDERGAALVEYGFLLLLVAFAAMAMLTIFGDAVLDMYTNNTAKLSTAVDTPRQN